MKQYWASLSETLKATVSVCRVLRSIRHLLAAIFLFALSEGVVYSVVLSEAFRHILDGAQQGIGGGFIRQVLAYVALVAAVAVVWGFGGNFLNRRVKSKVTILLRERMLESVLHCDKDRFDSLEIGDIEKRYTQDVANVAQFITRGLFSRILSPLIEGLVCAVILLFIHPLFALISVAVGLMCFFAQSRLLFPSQQFEEALSSKKGRLSNKIHDVILDLPVIRLFSAARSILEQMASINEGMYGDRKHILRIETRQAVTELLLNTVKDVALVAVGSILLGNREITYGVLVAAINYGAAVMAMFGAVSGGITGVQRGHIAVKRVLETITLGAESQHLQKGPEPVKDDRVPAIRVSNASIVLNDKRILSDVNVTVAQGERVAVLGSSGSGKTTLVQAMAGLLPPSEGEISVLGIRADICLARDADTVCYIPSQSHLFHDTLRRNVVLRDGDAADGERIESILKDLSLDEWLQQQPDGLDTVFTGAENSVSGGELQRIAAARSLVRDARIFIWDEPTSALDAPTRKLVLDAFARMPRHVTQIIVSHDPGTVPYMDRVLVICDGRITTDIPAAAFVNG